MEKARRTVIRRRRLLNQSFLAVVAFGSAIVLVSCAQVFAQPTEQEAEEQEVDLDSLDEELEDQSTDDSNNKEKFLPVNTELVDLERHPALALVALMVLMPLATLTFPLDRIRKGRRRQSKQNKKTIS